MCGCRRLVGCVGKACRVCGCRRLVGCVLVSKACSVDVWVSKACRVCVGVEGL